MTFTFSLKHGLSKQWVNYVYLSCDAVMKGLFLSGPCFIAWQVMQGKLEHDLLGNENIITNVLSTIVLETIASPTTHLPQPLPSIDPD